MACRHLASLLALGALLTAGEARAQGYGGYAPPYAPYAAPPPVYYVYTPVRRHNPAMAAGGIVLVALGGVALVAGATLVGAGGPTMEVFPPCPVDVKCDPIEQSRNPGLRDAGIGLLVGSVALLGAGIPLVVIGSRRVTDRPEPARSFLPDVRVGAGGLSARWSF
jgi:hypothetical protein